VPVVAASALPQVPQTQAEWGVRLSQIFGPPMPPRATQDNIWSTVWVQPYQGPLDVDPYSLETPAMRFGYRTQFRTQPVVRAAILGKAQDISCLEPTVLPADKDDRLSNLAAEFVKWTVSQAPRGWRGLIDTIYTPACIDGYSLAEKKLKVVRWKGRQMWGLAQVRGLDTANLRLELDQFRNVVAVVNMIRGLEYYSPDQCILYSHNPVYSNPFGVSDMRAATKAALLIEDTYKVWYVALQVYGLPYMVGKAKATNVQAMASALTALREGGYMVCDREEDVTILNLASAAASTGFQDMVHTQREDIFFAIRGVAQPFMEGDGGQDAHTDTSVQQSTSDAGEKASALDIESCLNEQLIPWLVRPNFGDIDMPRVKLGGTDWDQTKTIVDLAKSAKEIGAEISAEWFHEATNMPPPRDKEDVLAAGDDGEDAGQKQDLLGTVGGMQGIAALQAQFYEGKIPQAAAVANLMTVFGFQEPDALKMFPPVEAKKRTDDGQDAGGGMPGMPGAPPDAGGGMMSAATPPEPATFSATHDDDDDWEYLDGPNMPPTRAVRVPRRAPDADQVARVVGMLLAEHGVAT
jgi:hypothetical protein